MRNIDENQRKQKTNKIIENKEQKQKKQMN